MAIVESLEVARLERENKRLLVQRRQGVQEFILGIQNMPQLIELQHYISILFEHATADTATHENFWWDLIWDISFSKDTDEYLKGAFHSITLASGLEETPVKDYSSTLLHFSLALSDFETTLWWVGKQNYTLAELQLKQDKFKADLLGYLDNVEARYRVEHSYHGNPLRFFYTTLFLWEIDIPNPIPDTWEIIDDVFHVYIQFISGNELHFWFDYRNSAAHIQDYDGFENGIYTGNSEYI